MDTVLEELYMPSISSLVWKPEPHINRFKSCGHNFMINPEIGKGFYWLYPVGNRFGIANYEVKLSCDVPVEHPPTRFLYLGKLGIPGLGEHLGTGEMPVESIMGYIGSGKRFRMTMKKGIHIRGIGLSMTEGFANEILERCHAASIEQLEAAINRLGSGIMIPEISEVLRQIQGFQPSAKFADLYYESKVIEIMILALQWDRNRQRQAAKPIAESDLENLEEITHFIGDHFTQPISLNDLARRACMSRSKLTDLFKQVYRSNITDYHHNLRMQRAKQLLVHSELKIAAIADEVGYKRHSSFSEIFKQLTGLTPHEYRRLKLRQPKQMMEIR